MMGNLGGLTVQEQWGRCEKLGLSYAGFGYTKAQQMELEILHLKIRLAELELENKHRCGAIKPQIEIERGSPMHDPDPNAAACGVQKIDDKQVLNQKKEIQGEVKTCSDEVIENDLVNDEKMEITNGVRGVEYDHGATDIQVVGEDRKQEKDRVEKEMANVKVNVVLETGGNDVVVNASGNANQKDEGQGENNNKTSDDEESLQPRLVGHCLAVGTDDLSGVKERHESLLTFNGLGEQGGCDENEMEIGTLFGEVDTPKLDGVGEVRMGEAELMAKPGECKLAGQDAPGLVSEMFEMRGGYGKHEPAKVERGGIEVDVMTLSGLGDNHCELFPTHGKVAAPPSDLTRKREQRPFKCVPEHDNPD